jgi:hypothetical protein
MVQDPNEKVILEAQGERQGDFIFTANTVSLCHWQKTSVPAHSSTSNLSRQIGEYSFCFENEASLTSKLIDFEYVCQL